MSEKSEQSKTSSVGLGRTKMLVLIGLYALPLLAAWLWLGYVRSNEGVGVSVHGELIHPAVRLQEFGLSDHQGAAWPLENLREIWSMVYFSDGTCDTVCEQNLYHMRQVRLRTGRRMDRVQRVLVTPAVVQMTQKLAGASEGLQVVGGDVASFESQVREAEKSMPACAQCIYLVDPFGNVMMRFQPDLDPGEMYEDLQHLLKVSRIG